MLNTITTVKLQIFGGETCHVHVKVDHYHRARGFALVAHSFFAPSYVIKNINSINKSGTTYLFWLWSMTFLRESLLLLQLSWLQQNISVQPLNTMRPVCGWRMQPVLPFTFVFENCRTMMVYMRISSWYFYYFIIIIIIIYKFILKDLHYKRKDKNTERKALINLV